LPPTPLDPAFADWILKAPDVVKTAVPVIIDTDPPVDAVDSPALTTRRPPVSKEPEASDIDKLPATPYCDDPEDTSNEPLEPREASPLFILKLPLIPECPASTVAITTAPDVVLALGPERTPMNPPDAEEPDPPVRATLPPTPPERLDPLPAVTLMAPPDACVLEATAGEE
jgi:hypothetical protein